MQYTVYDLMSGLRGRRRRRDTASGLAKPPHGCFASPMRVRVYLYISETLYFDSLHRPDGTHATQEDITVCALTAVLTLCTARPARAHTSWNIQAKRAL